jgi:hypothetical protein
MKSEDAHLPPVISFTALTSEHTLVTLQRSDRLRFQAPGNSGGTKAIACQYLNVSVSVRGRPRPCEERSAISKYL